MCAAAALKPSCAFCLQVVLILMMLASCLSQLPLDVLPVLLLLLLQPALLQHPALASHVLQDGHEQVGNAVTR